jgi:CelD/BcsL family acetyltransferase involved in cellulose biosynthesis
MSPDRFVSSYAVLDLDDERWVAFAEGRGESPLQYPSWARLLADAYGFRAFAFALSDPGGGIEAGLPVLRLGGRLRPRWSSLPFTDSCPPLGSAETMDALRHALEIVRAEQHLRQIEVRGELVGGEACSRAIGVTHELRLEPDAESVFRRLDKKRVQSSIRKAERLGVVVRRATSAADLTESFYRLHALTRRRLGVPVQPRRFFALLWERMLEPGLGELLLAERERQILAGAVFLHSRNRTVYKYSASDPASWPYCPNHAILWRAIESSARADREVFDFARSDFGDRGLRAFKSGWGTEERPLVYTAIGGRAPTASLGRSAAAARGIIRRSPVWVSELLGRALYKYAA